MVAFVKSLIFSSVAAVPSQCADTKPALFSKTSLNSSKEKKQTPTRTQEVKRYGQMKVEDFLDSQSDEEEKYYRHLDEKRDESRVESSVSEIRVEFAVNDDA